MNWYILQVYSGSETKVMHAIEELALKTGFDKNIDEILVPTQDVTQLRYGKKVVLKKKFLPGYILLKMDLSEDLFHLIRSIPRVSNFVGSSKDVMPFPVSQEEVNKMLDITTNTNQSDSLNDVVFEVGEAVHIISGPFTSFNGVIQEVEHDKKKIIVAVSIFGRLTPVELEYMQVEKD